MISTYEKMVKQENPQTTICGSFHILTNFSAHAYINERSRSQTKQQACDGPGMKDEIINHP